jgi:hypothetical protein
MVSGVRKRRTNSLRLLNKPWNKSGVHRIDGPSISSAVEDTLFTSFLSASFIKAALL